MSIDKKDVDMLKYILSHPVDKNKLAYGGNYVYIKNTQQYYYLKYSYLHHLLNKNILTGKITNKDNITIHTLSHLAIPFIQMLTSEHNTTKTTMMKKSSTSVQTRNNVNTPIKRSASKITRRYFK